jgi:ribonucleoside-diphosphate reductase alpha chain
MKTGGDPNRKAPNLHHGVLIPDAFMRAVEADEEWPLLSPKDQSVVNKAQARALWTRMLTARIETGEPYLIFSDHVNKAIPAHHKLAGLSVKLSNLCTRNHPADWHRPPRPRPHRGQLQLHDYMK